MATLDNRGNPRTWVMESRLRLARRRENKPDTKAGQIRALWPEIDAALEGGQSLKTIRQWLEEDAGIALGITSLTSYISRIRRRESRTRRAQKFPPPEPTLLDHSTGTDTRTQGPQAGADPITQAMRALTKPRLDIRKLHSDGDPTGESLI